MGQSQRLNTKKSPSNQLSPEEEEEEGREQSLEQDQELIGRREAAILHLHQRKSYTLVAAVLPQCNTAEWPEGAPSCLMPCVCLCVCVQDCVDGVRCVRFVCPLADVKHFAVVSVRARLWSSSLVEVRPRPLQQAPPTCAGLQMCLCVCVFQDYSDASSVKVRGRASLKLKTSKTFVSQEHLSIQVVSHPNSLAPS